MKTQTKQRVRLDKMTAIEAINTLERTAPESIHRANSNGLTLKNIREYLTKTKANVTVLGYLENDHLIADGLEVHLIVDGLEIYYEEKPEWLLPRDIKHLVRAQKDADEIYEDEHNIYLWWKDKEN